MRSPAGDPRCVEAATGRAHNGQGRLSRASPRDECAAWFEQVPESGAIVSVDANALQDQFHFSRAFRRAVAAPPHWAPSARHRSWSGEIGARTGKVMPCPPRTDDENVCFQANPRILSVSVPHVRARAAEPDALLADTRARRNARRPQKQTSRRPSAASPPWIPNVAARSSRVAGPACRPEALVLAEPRPSRLGGSRGRFGAAQPQRRLGQGRRGHAVGRTRLR